MWAGIWKRGALITGLAVLLSGPVRAENWIELGRDNTAFAALDLDSLKGDPQQQHKATVLVVETNYGSPASSVMFVVRLYMEFDCKAVTAAMSGGARLNLADGSAEEFAQRQEPQQVEMAKRACAVPRGSVGFPSVASYVKAVEGKLTAGK